LVALTFFINKINTNYSSTWIKMRNCALTELSGAKSVIGSETLAGFWGLGFEREPRPKSRNVGWAYYLDSFVEEGPLCRFMGRILA
jgi:hypothetical protein